MVFIAKTGRNKIQRRPRLLPAGPLTLAPKAAGESFISPTTGEGVYKLVYGYKDLFAPVPDHSAASKAALRSPPCAIQAALCASAPPA